MLCLDAVKSWLCITLVVVFLLYVYLKGCNNTFCILLAKKSRFFFNPHALYTPKGLFAYFSGFQYYFTLFQCMYEAALLYIVILYCLLLFFLPYAKADSFVQIVLSLKFISSGMQNSEV